MDRRNFISRVAAAGTARLGFAGAAAAKETSFVNYRVKGFTCITCAVGLETMLRRQKGVTRASASYPRNSVDIGFDGNLTSEKALKEFIARCGFSVA